MRLVGGGIPPPPIHFLTGPTTAHRVIIVMLTHKCVCLPEVVHSYEGVKNLHYWQDGLDFAHCWVMTDLYKWILENVKTDFLYQA